MQSPKWWRQRVSGPLAGRMSGATVFIEDLAAGIAAGRIAMPQPGYTIGVGDDPNNSVWALRGAEPKGKTRRVHVLSRRFDPADGWVVVGTLVYARGRFSHIDWTDLRLAVAA